MSARDTAATPIVTSSPVHVREVLGVVKATLGNIEQQFRTIEGQTAGISTFQPSRAQASAEIQALYRQIEEQDKQHASHIDEMKEKLRMKFKEQAEKEHQSMIQEEIRRELQEQVRKEVQSQIKELLPMSSSDQIKEIKDYTTRINNAHKNSEARGLNGNLGQTDMEHKLEVVLTPKGKTTNLYPNNIVELVYYPDAKMKKLLDEYELTPLPKHFENVNRFLMHIGIGFSVMPQES